MNNSETSYNAKFGTATLDKFVQNGDGKALSSDNESDIKTLSDIYKSTKFIVGYWGVDENGKPVLKISPEGPVRRKAFCPVPFPHQCLQSCTRLTSVRRLTYTHISPFRINTSPSTINSPSFPHTPHKTPSKFNLHHSSHPPL